MTLEVAFEDEHVRLLHGDALEAFGSWSPSTFGVLLSDPPYGVDHQPQESRAPWTKRAIVGDRDTALRDAMISWAGEDFPMLIFEGFTKPIPEPRLLLVWDKGPSVSPARPADLPWRRNVEFIAVLGKGWVGVKDHGCVYRVAVPTGYGGRGRGRGIAGRPLRAHPHQKPIVLLEALLERCPPGVVLDPFAGAGSTLVACQRLGRQAVGIELEERWLEVAVRRLKLGGRLPPGAW